MGDYMASSVVEVDGSMLEGGGQILRIALACSALTGRSVRVIKIRSGRPKPGLMAQHLAGVNVVRDVCNGKLVGGHLGSTVITLHPGRISGGIINAVINTAGSVALLLQVSLPCVLFGQRKSTLILEGGTNAEMAPQIDYVTGVFKPVLSQFGATFDCQIERRGYFPKGGGKVVVNIEPVKYLNAIERLDCGSVEHISGAAFVAGVLPLNMAHAAADTAVSRIKSSISSGIPVNIQRYKERPDAAVGNGSGINLFAETSTGCHFGGSSLGKRGLSAEEVGQRAADDLLESIHQKTCLDKYSQDQVILFMAIAKGRSRVRTGPITQHTRTAIYAVETVLGVKFRISEVESCSNIIECEGIGLSLSSQ